MTPDITFRESFFFLERTLGFGGKRLSPERSWTRICFCGLLWFLWFRAAVINLSELTDHQWPTPLVGDRWLRVWWSCHTCNVFINYISATFIACHWNKILTLLIALVIMKLFSTKSQIALNFLALLLTLTAVKGHPAENVWNYGQLKCAKQVIVFPEKLLATERGILAACVLANEEFILNIKMPHSQ